MSKKQKRLLDFREDFYQLLQVIYNGVKKNKNNCNLDHLMKKIRQQKQFHISHLVNEKENNKVKDFLSINNHLKEMCVILMS